MRLPSNSSMTLDSEFRDSPRSICGSVDRASRQFPGWFWISFTALWISIILFSSTAIARRWSERAFKSLAAISSPHRPPSGTSYDLVHFFAEKCVHVGLFLVFAILLTNALPRSHRKIRFILMIGTVVGSTSELLQRFFPGRDPTVRDVCINIAATAVGALISHFVFRFRSQMTEL